MILDYITSARLYAPISRHLSTAFDYLTTTNFTDLPKGKYEVDGENVFAIVNEYETKDQAECVLEAHKKYIDIHYTLAGFEHIGVALLGNQPIAKPYDEENDFQLFIGETTLHRVSEGMFVVLFPQDVHMPGTHPSIEQKSWVRKVVMKVKVGD